MQLSSVNANVMLSLLLLLFVPMPKMTKTDSSAAENPPHFLASRQPRSSRYRRRYRYRHRSSSFLLLVQLALIRTHKRHQLSTEHWCHSFEFMRVRFDRQSHSLAPCVQIFRVFLCLSPTSDPPPVTNARFLLLAFPPVPFDIAREKLCDDCLRRKPSEKHGSRAHRYEHRSVAQSPPKWKHISATQWISKKPKEEKEDGVSIRRAHRRRSRRVQRSKTTRYVK